MKQSQHAHGVARSMRRAGAMVGFVVVCGSGATALAADFAYRPPGELVSGSGRGRADNTVYVPNMRFPLEETPAFANSQVWGRGGSRGPGGGQCDAANYAYPWYDNYCESRSWEMPLCPSGTGHQGQDIRPATCRDKAHWAVAAEDGTITSIGSYSVYLTTASGTVHRYLHMDPASVTVQVGDRVRREQRLGLVSNAFGGASTTIHLHYDIRMNVEGYGAVYVPTYMSLVRSYEALLGRPAVPCGGLGAEGGTIDDGDPCFELGGDVSSWRSVQGSGHGGDLRWTYAFSNATPDATARWNLNLAEAGLYRVEVHVDGTYGKSARAPYRLRHAGGRQSSATLDQSASAGWRTLGEWEFAAGGAQHLELLDNTGEPLDTRVQLVADAVRLTRVRTTPPPPPSEPDAGASVDPGTGTPPDREVPQGEPDAGGSTPGGVNTPTQPVFPTDKAASRATSTSSCAAADGTPASAWAWVAMLVWAMRGRGRRRPGA